jgi:hypothetical protein
VHEPTPPDRAVPSPRLELRIEQGHARVGLGRTTLGDGLALLDLEMEVAGPPAPFDPGAGTAPFRLLPCALVRLEVASEAAGEAGLPGPDALPDLVARALSQVGWPVPELTGLRHAVLRDGPVARATWLRPGDEARALLHDATEARRRGDDDAALRLSLAGQAALAAGLPVEGEAALRSAIDLGLGRDEARDAWGALAALAREHADVPAERAALSGLVRAAPTGERPALLLRLAGLAAGAGDVAAARVHADEARTLAPRDPDTTRACLELAREAGDGEAVVDLLDRLAVLEPDGAGGLLLERARLVATAARFADADAAYAEALSRLPPQRALADEHAALRRQAPAPVGNAPWGEPLETFASRTASAAEAAQALRDASALSRAQGDRASALRAARRAQERSGELAMVGLSLAELLHAGGSVVEALDLHRRLLGPGQPPLDPEAAADRLVALAELAEESGDRPAATEALDRLLDLRPHDAEALSWRFRVDPDRARAVARLAEGAEGLRSRRSRTRLLLRAAAAARAELGDAPSAARLRALARESAAGNASAVAEVAREEVAAARALAGGAPVDGDHPARALADALLGLASVLHDAGDERGAAAALEEAETAALSCGESGSAVLARVLAARAARSGGAVRAGHLVALARLRRAALADDEGAMAALREALEASPGDSSAEAELDRLLASTGRLAELGRALLSRASRVADADDRARLRLRAAEVLFDSGDESARAEAAPALLAVLAEPPPGRATLLEAAGRLASLGRGADATSHLLALCLSDPFDGAAARVLARALADAPAERAAAFREIAAAAPQGPIRAGHLREAAAACAEAGNVPGLREAGRAAFEAWPVDDLAFRGALADASGDVDATDAILTLRASAVPAEAAACHRTRADLLASAGRHADAARAYEACLAAGPAEPGALLGLAQSRAAAGDAAGALAAARGAADAAAASGRPADRRVALETGSHVALAVGDRGEDAAAILEALALLLLDERPGGDPEVSHLASRAAASLVQAGEDGRASALLSRVAASESAPEEPARPPREHEVPAAVDVTGEWSAGPPAEEASGEAPGPSIADLLRPLLSSARAFADAGELGAAYARLKLAREIDPEHLELTLGLARVAEKLGHLDEAIALGEAWADAVAGSDPARAAARYRDLADTARVRLADANRATALLEKASALEPHDAATAAALASLRASRRDEALVLLDEHVGKLRTRPSDFRSARAVAVLSRELAAGEESRRTREARLARAAVAEALSRFGQRLGPAPAPLELAHRIDSAVRGRVALPGADGPTARLVSLLAPYLEPLFPVDLARWGVGPSDRVTPAAAGPFLAALQAATGALNGRPLAVFAGRRPGLYAALENTRPPSLVLAPDVTSLPAGALAFLAARSVALASSCGALLGKFAPRDAAILCELASRFAGGEPPPHGLPLERAGAFLAALERTVPPSMRDWVSALGPPSAAELATLDPRQLESALTRTANRLALVHAGDLHGALAVLARLQRPGETPPADPLSALERPDLADLAAFALSDEFLLVRGMLLGWS